MASTRWRKVLRDSWLHRGRTALVIVAIVVSLAGAGVILNAWALVEVATREGFDASHPASATLRVDEVTDSMLAIARAHPDVRMAQGRRTTFVRAQVGGAAFTAMLFTVRDFTDIRIGTVAPLSGAWPPRDGALVIERSSLDMSGAAVGEEMRLSTGEGGHVAVPVTGIARDVGLAPGWMEHIVYGFVTAATLEQLRVPSTLNELQLVIGDGSLGQEEVRQRAYAVAAALEGRGHHVADVSVPVPGEHPHAAQMDSLLYTQGAFALMSLLLSAFLVVNLMSALLVGQVREIGVMKTVGARWTQLATMYLAMAALLGVAAVVIALPIAIAGGRTYAALKGEMLNFEIAPVAIPAWVLALQVVVGVLVPVIAAAFPVWHGCRIAVNDALRDVGISSAAAPGTVSQRIRGLSRPLVLSLRNAFRRRQRLVFTLLALSTGGAVFLGSQNLRTSVIGATDLMFDAQHFDLSLRLADPADPVQLAEVVAAVDGVEGVEAWAGARAILDHGAGVRGNAFSIIAPPATTRLLTPRPDSGRWLAAGDGRVIVINRALLRAEPSLQLGGRARLLIDGTANEWTIVGVAESGTTATAFAPREALDALTGQAAATTVVVASAYDSENATLDLILRLRSALADAGMPVASSQLIAESRRVIEDHLLLVVDFLASVGWLMLLVGGLALGSTMGLSVLERTREIGVLRAIGAGHGQIVSLVQVEGLTIALLSWAVAIPVSVPISALLASAFARIMLRVPVRYVPEASGVVAWLGLVLVVSAVACAWPAVRALRVPVAGALGWE